MVTFSCLTLHVLAVDDFTGVLQLVLDAFRRPSLLPLEEEASSKEEPGEAYILAFAESVGIGCDASLGEGEGIPEVVQLVPDLSDKSPATVKTTCTRFIRRYTR